MPKQWTQFLKVRNYQAKKLKITQLVPMVATSFYIMLTYKCF